MELQLLLVIIKTMHTAVNLLKQYLTNCQNSKFNYFSAQSRKVSSAVVDTHLKLASELQEHYPDFVVGFDLVGQEDLGRPLVEFAPQLLEAKATYPGLNFFFHAGETDWQGSQADLNIMDAVLLNATRIGHGYSITKHPKVLQMARDRDIPIEVCPISNQVSYIS